MLVSYIITTCNRHALLERAIASVVAERCTDSELIVVDDGSQPAVDLPASAYAAFPGAVRLLRHAESRGVIGARNAGIEAARGQYLLFLDDDDTSLPNRTQDLLAAIAGSKFHFVAARAVMTTGTTDKIVPEADGLALTPQLLLLHPSHINAIIWRRSSLAAADGLDNRIPYLGEHVTMMQWLLQGKKAWLSPAVVAQFSYLELGLTQTTRQAQKMSDQLLAFYDWLLTEQLDPVFRACCREVQQQLTSRLIHSFDDYLELLRAVLAARSYQQDSCTAG